MAGVAAVAAATAAVIDAGGRVRLTVFTVEEANQVVAQVRPEMETLVRVQRELDVLEKRIAALSLAVSGASPRNPDAMDLQALIQRRSLLAGQLSQGVHAIHRRGCLVKDLKRGLLDFYAVSGDRLIFLCWQLGEPEVAHWHTLEAGFTGRQPLHHTELD
jgi:hypothetical protein